MQSYKIVIEQFSSEFEVSKGKTQERSFANCPGGGRGCKRGAPGVVGVSGIEGLSDKFDCAENWIERALRSPWRVWEDSQIQTKLSV